MISLSITSVPQINGGFLVIRIALISVGIVGLFSGICMAQPKSEVVISFSAPATNVALLEPAFVQLFIINNLPEGIRADLGHNFKSRLRFTITAPDGKVKKATPMSDEGLGLIGRVVIGSGKTYSRRFLLNEWYQFDETGTYRIDASLDSAVQTESGKIIKPRVNSTIAMTVSPADKERLDKICQNLAHDAIQSYSADTASEAALALTYVKDPIAIPWLGKILKEGVLVREQAVRGLTRIGSPEAVRTLISGLSTQDAELRLLISDALRRLKTTVLDPSLRNEIDKALTP